MVFSKPQLSLTHSDKLHMSHAPWFFTGAKNSDVCLYKLYVLKLCTKQN